MTNCSEHKNYAGKRAPRGECKTCWCIYFSANTDERQKKYPDEYKKYFSTENKTVKRKKSTKTKKQSTETIKQPASVTRINGSEKLKKFKTNLNQIDPNKLYVDVPLLLGLRLWSQRLNTTIVINNYYSDKDLVEFSMVTTKLIPREQLHNLLLFHHVPKWTKKSDKFAVKEEVTIPVFNGNLAKIQEKFSKALKSLYPENRTSNEHQLFPWTLHDDLLVIENNQFLLDDDFQPKEEDFKKTFDETINAGTKKS